MELESLIERLRGNRAAFQVGEEATKQGAILPILATLGWDRDDIHQVVPEYTVEGGRVDYCLKIGARNKVFIEVKRFNEELDQHQEQLLEYAFREGVPLAVLTNGLVWWLYLPLSAGSWSQRKFLALDLQVQEPEVIVDHMRNFLAFERVKKGDAVRMAEALHASREKDHQISDTIPKAWQALCSEPDELLLELLADKVESMCGHRPEQEALAKHLLIVSGGPSSTAHSSASIASIAGARSIRREPPSIRVKQVRPISSSGPTYTGKRPTQFTLLGTTRQVSTFRDVLLGVCNILSKQHGPGFEAVTQLRGRKRPYFTSDGSELRAPQPIDGTRLFVETNLSANNIMSILSDVLLVLGHKSLDLTVDAE